MFYYICFWTLGYKDLGEFDSLSSTTVSMTRRDKCPDAKPRASKSLVDAPPSTVQPPFNLSSDWLLGVASGSIPWENAALGDRISR